VLENFYLVRGAGYERREKLEAKEQKTQHSALSTQHVTKYKFKANIVARRRQNGRHRRSLVVVKYDVGSR